MTTYLVAQAVIWAAITVFGVAACLVASEPPRPRTFVPVWALVFALCIGQVASAIWLLYAP